MTKERKKYEFKNGPGRRNRGLIKVVSFKVTEDCHEALLEYIARQEQMEPFERYIKGAQYGSYGMADYLRKILAAFLERELGREIVIYEEEDVNA